MQWSKKILSQTITQLCLAKGIDHVVISPGSRNAPLTIGFTSHPDFKNYSIVDERCAAFFALGMAQQLKKPVALVCTSGSALLNYYPAIAEAFYSDIPLVVISADRPSHLVDVGDGQTIRQENVFANHILYNANCKEADQYTSYNQDEINKALNTAILENGPVHINVPFEEPLYETVAEPIVVPKSSALTTIREILPNNFESLKKTWGTSKRKMILVGVLAPNSLEEEIVNTLAKDESVIVFTETTSNLHNDNFFPCIDQLIAPLKEELFKELRPELLLTFGGMVVSKKIKAFLRAYPPSQHWHVDSKNAPNTYFVLNEHIKTAPQFFLKHLYDGAERTRSNFRDYWYNFKKRRYDRHHLYLMDLPFCDLTVFSELVITLPKGVDLHLANSATIRYSQLFQLKAENRVYCNRGTSGIDGSTSTAIGSAVASSKPTLFITGDLSFFYDSNALWNSYIPNSFRVVVVNNGGGGIFRILPKAKEATHFETYFETKHQLTAKQLCEMFGFEYSAVSNTQDLFKNLKYDFYKESDRPKLLEVFTPSNDNDTLLLDYFKFIR